jgi:hypothetical protein
LIFFRLYEYVYTRNLARHSVVHTASVCFTHYFCFKAKINETKNLMYLNLNLNKSNQKWKNEFVFFAWALQKDAKRLPIPFISLGSEIFFANLAHPNPTSCRSEITISCNYYESSNITVSCNYYHTGWVHFKSKRKKYVWPYARVSQSMQQLVLLPVQKPKKKKK